jgi:predicted ATPase/class 3 adenylate cyclase
MVRAEGGLPTGTVTFLFTDLEVSTRLWEEHPEAMKNALARHDSLLRAAVDGHHGRVVKARGDGVHAVFASAHDALDAAVAAQRALCLELWGETGPLQVRMGVHTGEADQREGDYFGSAVNRAARLMAAAHGGQVVVSQATEAILCDGLPGDVGLVDLGVHGLRDLSRPERIFQVTAPGLPAEFARLRSLDVLPGNLPRQVTTFVGREREIETLGELVRDRSVVTLTGVGGVGKTRLAVQVAAEVVPDFPDGAWLCELAPVGDPGAVWESVAASLGVQPFPGRALDEAVLEYLGPKRLLMVLDNCEHLLDAVAHLVDAVTHRCPSTAVLATSREGLALVGEQLVAVPPLSVPAEGDEADALVHADAVRLFVDRAQDANREFVLTEHNAPAVAQLCRRLDGIPLAIELAAARVRVLTPEDLVKRLDQRFRLLTRGSRSALERHQTLRSAIDWSYDLLSAIERAALNRLSVFAGGCELSAAQAVLADDDLDAVDVIDALGQLVDKSLVDMRADEVAGTRYSLLESIRQYAQERLEASGDADVLRHRHADYFVGVAEAAGPGLRSREQLVFSAAAARDVDNFRAALDWAVEVGSADHALRLVAPLAVAGMAIGDADLTWADAARSIARAEEHELFPVVVAWAAWGKVMRGDAKRGGELSAEAEAAQQRLGTRHLWVHMASATAAFFSGDMDRAYEHAEEWVRRARPTGNAYELANALVMLASTLQTSDRAAGLPIIEEAVHIARTGGIGSALSIGLTVLAGYMADDDPKRTRVILDEALAVGRRVGDRQAVAQVPLLRGWLAGQRAEWLAALRGALDAAEHRLALGDMQTMPGALGLASIALAHLGALEPSAVLSVVKTGVHSVREDLLKELERTRLRLSTSSAQIESRPCENKVQRCPTQTPSPTYGLRSLASSARTEPKCAARGHIRRTSATT